MRLIDRLFGSDQHLTRPNFDKGTPWQTSLSGNILHLMDAPHKWAIYRQKLIESLNIWDQDALEDSNTGHFGKKIYTCEWEYLGRNRKYIGASDVTIVVFYYQESYRSNINVFTEQDLVDMTFEVCGEHREEDKENSSFCYPRHKSAVRLRVINGNTYGVIGGLSGGTPNLHFFTPITDRHLLHFDFRNAPYPGINFYSEDHNLIETGFGVIEDFMQHVEISLTPQSQQFKQEAAIINQQNRDEARFRPMPDDWYWKLVLDDEQRGY